MSKKVQNSIGLTQDILTRFTLSDKTHNSQLKYHFEGFINNIKYNTTKKKLRIDDLHEQNAEAVHQHIENGQMLDRDAILKREQDMAWLQDQLNVNDDLRTLLEEMLNQLFPADEKIKEADDQAILARYSA
jgi:hypothetical protein